MLPRSKKKVDTIEKVLDPVGDRLTRRRRQNLIAQAAAPF
jgi:hypothetical protein